MDIIETTVKGLSDTEAIVSMVLTDGGTLEEAKESIQFTVRIEHRKRPLLQAIQATALDRVKDVVERQRREIIGLS